MWCDNAVGNYVLIELDTHFSTAHRVAWNEDNGRLTGQEIPRILLNPGFHYRVCKIPPFFPILPPMNAAHTSPSNFCKVNFNVLPSTPMSASSQSFMSYQNSVCIFLTRVVRDPRQHSYADQHPAVLNRPPPLPRIAVKTVMLISLPHLKTSLRY
jgi:hypothetical protein